MVLAESENNLSWLLGDVRISSEVLTSNLGLVTSFQIFHGMKNLSAMALLFNSILIGYTLLKSERLLESLKMQKGIFEW